MPNNLEKLEFKLEKDAGKVRKNKDFVFLPDPSLPVWSG